MRLYLSSSGLGKQPQALCDLVGPNKSATIILNACDCLTNSQRRVRLEQETVALGDLGFNPVEADLRNYFGNRGRPDALSAALAGCGLIWVRGGNTFVLRRAMRASGFDEFVIDCLKRDALVYGGYSAGICVLGPSLHGLELVDDIRAIPSGYPESIIWEGLGVLPYALAPHYRSDHPESPLVEALVDYYVRHRSNFRILHDGQAIVVNGADTEVIPSESMD